MACSPRLRCLVFAALVLTLIAAPGRHTLRSQSLPRQFTVSALTSSDGTIRAGAAIDDGGFPQLAANGVTAAGDARAFIGTVRQMRPVDTLGGAHGEVRAMSYGLMVGGAQTAAGDTHAFRMSYGNAPLDLGTLGGSTSVANGIAGHYVVGTSTTPGERTIRPFLFDDRTGALSELPISFGGVNATAAGVNEAGHVVGHADAATGSSSIGYLYADGVARDVGTLGGSTEPRTLNASDQIVGRSRLSLGGPWHAFEYADGVMRDLGTLGGSASDALDITPDGTVVGWAEDASGNRRATLWDGGTVVDLNSTIPPDSGWTLEVATGVNDLGAIVGYGRLNGAPRAFVLSPPMDLRLDMRVHQNNLDTNIPNPHEATQPLTFGATVYSNGPFTVTGVTVDMAITGPVEIVGRSGAAACDQDGLTLSCRLEPFDFWRDLFVTVRATGPGDITHTSSIRPDYPDPNPSNNQGTESNVAVSLATLALGQMAVGGGSPVLGRTTLTTPTPGGGARITLASSQPAVASVPSEFDVLPGCCDGGMWREFYVWTAPVSVPTRVDISATYGGVTRTVPLTILPAGGQFPFEGTPAEIPGIIEAERFDDGGEGVAWHDSSVENEGGAYRDTAVDLASADDEAGGYTVGWIGAGEWLAYTLDVRSSGTYTVSARVASAGVGGTFHLEVNGLDQTGPIAVPDTGGWQSWTTAVRGGVHLTAGRQVLRVVMDTVGPSQAVGNINWIRFARTDVPTPFNGSASVIPGTIEAEHFDEGGEGIGWHDLRAGNEGGDYRDTDVDLAVADDDGRGYTVGWIGAGEWLTYTVDVTVPGVYTVDARVASAGPGGTFHIEVDGVDRTGAIAVPDTGGWQQWTTVTRGGVRLAAGRQMLRVVMDSAGVSYAVGNVNWLRFAMEAATSTLRMTSPTPGTMLRTAVATFDWTGDGDEFWLDIGSVPGEHDVYRSGSLGAVHGHRVDRLPLNGAPMYVQVRRRIGTAVDTVHTEYTAAVRKGLAIVTDFADRRLEDWTDTGMRTLDDVRAQLSKQEAHWAWLSHGRERLRWDIVRIQLPQPAAPNAYPSWWDFRNAVGELALGAVDLADYDVNADGVLDISWSIASIGADSLPFVIGGSSMNAGVNMFVDGQASDSIKGGHTGNFTHETGHLVGLPDMYGTYGTFGSLTVMSYSWDLPPGDFTAYERTQLGWVTPAVLSAGSTRVWLPEAHGQFAAVKVQTARPSEYFLLEYRRRPDGGYGSADVPYDGLLVTHVLEGSSMGQYPPVAKVEPADGVSIPSRPTDPLDLFYPAHPQWLARAVFRSYLDDTVAFTLDDVSWTNGGMTVDVTVGN